MDLAARSAEGPANKSKQGRIWLADGSCIRVRAERPNPVWSYDFVEDRIATGTGGWTRLSGYLRNMTVGLAFGVAIEVVGAPVLKYVGGAALEKIADARDLAKLIRAEGIPAVRVTSLITRRPEQRAAKVERGAEAVRDAISRTIVTLPEQLRRSLTWDQGAEMAQHARLKIEAGVRVYFCDPHSPWQRGTNENTNGLLRQYFPKGTDLSMHSANEFAAVAAALNSRPRKTLDWKTPAEALDRFLLSADKDRVATTA